MSCRHDIGGTSDCVVCEFEPFVRNNYFTGKMMGASDFIAETHFHQEKLRLHQVRLHGWGVVCGLHVLQHPNADCRRRYVRVEPGSAVDCCGHDILVPEEEILDLLSYKKVAELTKENPPRIHSLGICVRYVECATENVPVLYDDCGCDDNGCAPNRILESYAFNVLVDPSLVVAVRSPARRVALWRHLRGTAETGLGAQHAPLWRRPWSDRRLYAPGRQAAAEADHLRPVDTACGTLDLGADAMAFAGVEISLSSRPDRREAQPQSSRCSQPARQARCATFEPRTTDANMLRLATTTKRRARWSSTSATAATPRVPGRTRPNGLRCTGGAARPAPPTSTIVRREPDGSGLRDRRPGPATGAADRLCSRFRAARSAALPAGASRRLAGYGYRASRSSQWPVASGPASLYLVDRTTIRSRRPIPARDQAIERRPASVTVEVWLHVLEREAATPGTRRQSTLAPLAAGPPGRCRRGRSVGAGAASCWSAPAAAKRARARDPDRSPAAIRSGTSSTCCPPATPPTAWCWRPSNAISRRRTARPPPAVADLTATPRPHRQPRRAAACSPAPRRCKPGWNACRRRAASPGRGGHKGRRERRRGRRGRERNRRRRRSRPLPRSAEDPGHQLAPW